MITPRDLPTLYELATTMLRIEETVAATSPDLAEWQSRQARRAVLDSHLHQLSSTLADLRRRFDQLPRLPRAEHVRWAMALLAFPNLAFLEVDTDGLGAESDLLRIALVDQAGIVLYDQLLQPRHPISARIAHITGLTQEQLSDAPCLAEAWETVGAAMRGRYVLSFNLEFDTGKLAENAARSHLPPLPLVGDCLMQRAQEYYGEYHYPRLSALCERLGFALPDHPQQDALDRARGQVSLLQAMAQGLTRAPRVQETQAAGADEPPDDGDPFLPDFPDEQQEGELV